MADIALGSVAKIMGLALKIKEAVETVKQNEKECGNIQTFMARVSALIKELDEKTETMKNKAMRDTLEDLAVSLKRALELVTQCSGSTSCFVSWEPETRPWSWAGCRII
jgi:L1 cell adhesion molecule like protein